MNDLYDNPVAKALEKDLLRIGLDQKDLPERLAVGDEPAISASAISAWKARGVIPSRRLKRLLEIFGPDSELAKVTEFSLSSMLGRATDTRMQASDPPEFRRMHTFKALMDSGVPAYMARLGRENLREHLPAELWPNVERAVRLPAGVRRFDYLSDKVAVEIRSAMRSGAPFPSVYKRMIELVILRDQASQSGLQPRHYVLALLPAKDDTPALRNVDPQRESLRLAHQLGDLVTDCNALGIEPLLHIPLSEVAEAIVQMENGHWHPRQYEEDEGD